MTSTDFPSCFSQSWGEYRSQSEGLDHPWLEPRNVSSQTTDLCLWFFKYSLTVLSINSYFIWTEYPLLSNNLHSFPLASLLTSIFLTIRQFSKSVIFELSWFSFLFWFISRPLSLSLVCLSSLIYLWKTLWPRLSRMFYWACWPRLLHWVHFYESQDGLCFFKKLPFLFI